MQFVQRGGWVVRGLHFWAAQSLFVLAAVHVVHGALAASYRKPGEIGWWLTLLVLGLAVAEGITGGLLPWDQLGWWARVVEGNIAGLAPVIGGFVSQMIAGGSELGALGLARAFTLHVMLLPPLIALALWGRRTAGARPRRVSAAHAPHRPRSHARMARNVCVAALVVFALFALDRLGARRAARGARRSARRLPGSARVVSRCRCSSCASSSTARWSSGARRSSRPRPPVSS